MTLLSRGALLVGCAAVLSLPSAARADFGDPLPNLNVDQLAKFQGGKSKFSEIETVADGLGPVFNEASCKTCHVGPNGAVGGTTQRLETRFGRIRADGSFDPLAELGGSLLQDHAIGLVNGVNFVPEVVPPQATVVAGRRTTPLFGLGLVDAVPDSTFIALALTQAIFAPSTAGTPSVVTNLVNGRQAIGKFGWKAQVANLFVFSADAYLNEMGVTSPLFPNESCPQGNCALLAANPRPDLNDADGADVEHFFDFMTFLGPPPRGAQGFFTSYGNLIAASIGCLDCHTSSLTTGANAVAALSLVTFAPYSDFLLHDMGALGDGITQNRATGRLMRTQPLWGLRTQTRLLHDGRATTIEQAIGAHDGQGSGARGRFNRLGSFDRSALIAFLKSL